MHFSKFPLEQLNNVITDNTEQQGIQQGSYIITLKWHKRLYTLWSATNPQMFFYRRNFLVFLIITVIELSQSNKFYKQLELNFSGA